MTTVDKIEKKARAHVIYKNQFGKRVPGVTTILGVLDKPALVYWANNMGLKGINTTKYVDEMADIGTLCHYMVECDLKGEKTDTSNYSKNQIDLAENGFIKYLDWKERNNIKVLGSEMQVISESTDTGGTVDLYAEINGKPTVVDFKTCKGFYSEHFTQAAVYGSILRECKKPVDEIRILRIGRDESEGFEEQVVDRIPERWHLFEHCRKIYELNKLLK